MDIYFELKRTVKQTIVYALGNISTKLAGFILVPLYTAYLPVSEYGILGLIELVLQVMIILGGLGLASALIRWYSLPLSEEEKKKLLFTTTVTSLAVGAAFSLLSLIIAGPLAELLFGNGVTQARPSEFAYYIRLLTLSAAFELLLVVPLSLLRIQERAVFFSVLSFTRFALLVIINWVLLTVYRLGIEGVLWGILLSTVVSYALLLPYLLRNIRFGFLVPQLKEMLRFGLPLMGAGLAIVVLNLGDRYLLKLLSTLESVGLYTLGYRIAGLISLLFVSSFGLGYYPAIFKIGRGPEGRAFLSKTFMYFTFAVFWSVLVLSTLAPEILRLIAVNPVYWEADKVIFLLSVGFAFHGMFNVLLAGFFLEKRTGLITALVSGTVLLNIGLNTILIPRWDIIGAAVATVLSYGSMVVATALLVNRVYAVEYRWGRVLTVIILAAGLYALSFLWSGVAIWSNVALDLVIAICFPFFLYLLKFFEAEDLHRVRSWIGRILAPPHEESS